MDSQKLNRSGAPNFLGFADIISPAVTRPHMDERYAVQIQGQHSERYWSRHFQTGEGAARLND